MIQNNDTRDKIELSIGRSNNYPMRKRLRYNQSKINFVKYKIISNNKKKILQCPVYR